MSRRFYAALIAVFLFVLAGASLYLLSTDRPAEKPSPPDIGGRLAKSVTSSMDDFRFVDQGAEGTRLDVAAKRAVLRNRKYRHFRLATGTVLELEGPEFQIYNRFGDATEIKARSAVVDPAKKAVFFEDAAAKSPDGKTLEAGSLEWRYARREIVVEGHYRMRCGCGSDAASFEGDGARLDMNLNSTEIY